MRKIVRLDGDYITPAMLENFGFKMLNPLRPQLRDNQSVEWWYSQNMVLFSSPAAIDAHPALAECGEVPRGLESERIRRWVVDLQVVGQATRAPKLTRQVLHRAARAVWPTDWNLPVSFRSTTIAAAESHANA